ALAQAQGLELVLVVVLLVDGGDVVGLDPALRLLADGGELGGPSAAVVLHALLAAGIGVRGEPGEVRLARRGREQGLVRGGEGTAVGLDRRGILAAGILGVAAEGAAGEE